MTPGVYGNLPRTADAIQMPPVVLKDLRAGAPLTILRAARGFGKTTALVRWLAALDDAAVTIYCALDNSAHEAEGFWSTVSVALAGAGLAVGSAGIAGGNSDESSRGEPVATRELVMVAIRSSPVPLRLVLDNFHDAGRTRGASGIDDDLVDLLRFTNQFSLVVSGRTLRSLESTGVLAVETSIIGPDEFKLGAEEVQALAAAQGMNLSLTQCTEIAVDLGGWPSAIRAGLQHASAGDGVDESVVAGYVTAVLRDIRHGKVGDFLLRTASLDSFNFASLRPLYDTASIGPVVHGLRSAGLLQAEREPGGSTRYYYAPGIRRALLAAMREINPEAEREVHRALMSAAGDDRDLGNALAHAMAAGEWAAVAAMIESDWVRLLTSDPHNLVRAAVDMPPELRAGVAKVEVARTHVSAVVDRARPAPWAVVQHLSTTVEIAEYIAESPVPIDAKAAALLEWGVACMMISDHNNGMYAFNQARERGLQGGGLGAVVLGTMGLALVHALAGEPDQARVWLAELEVDGLVPTTPPTDSRDLLGVVTWFTRALIASDAGELKATRLASEILDPRYRGDFWAIGVFVRAHGAVLNDDGDELYRQAVHLRSALRNVARRTLIESVLQSELVELLVFTSLIAAASGVAKEMSEDSIGHTARAKVALKAGDYEQADATAQAATDTGVISARSALECAVIQAEARFALGDLVAAKQAFAMAIRLSRDTGQRRPFLLMRRYTFDQLGGAAGQLSDHWPRVAEPSEPVPSTFGVLTERESQVLGALERHAGPVGIAETLGVSVNTVKSQLRAVYKKLGVTSRTEALRVVAGKRVSSEIDAE